MPLCFPEPPMPAEQTEPADWESSFASADEELSWCPEFGLPQLTDDDRPVLLDQRGRSSQPPPEKRRQQASEAQLKFWRDQTAYKNSIAAKLREVKLEALALKLERCHTTYTVATCLDCGAHRTFPNRCDLFFCPECYHSLTAHRTKQVRWWVNTIHQPKHVCLTIKNIPTLEGGHIDELRKMFRQLRRRKFARNWKGGFYSIQVTHSVTGWHLHIHALINARWIDQPALCLNWDSITHGAGRITKVMDCREQSYLERVTGYVARGTEVASWQPSLLLQFITSFTGKRTFSVFGDLYGMRTEFREWVESLREAKPRCDCGSCRVKYQAEADWIWQAAQSGLTVFARPPPPEHQQQQLAIIAQAWPD